MDPDTEKLLDEFFKEISETPEEDYENEEGELAELSEQND